MKFRVSYILFLYYLVYYVYLLYTYRRTLALYLKTTRPIRLFCPSAYTMQAAIIGSTEKSAIRIAVYERERERESDTMFFTMTTHVNHFPIHAAITRNRFRENSSARAREEVSCSASLLRELGRVPARV